MIVLDTNVISEPTKPSPQPQVLAWMNAQPETLLYLTTPTIAELSSGSHRILLRDGSRKYADRLSQLLSIYSERILSFDLVAAEIFGNVLVRRERAGKPILVIDAMIAAICLAHGATLATRNTRDFDGLDLKLVNPFEAGV